MPYLHVAREAIYSLVMAICLAVAVVGIAVFAATGEAWALLFCVIYVLGAGVVALLPEDLTKETP